MLPSGNLTWLWKITILSGKIHYKWSFSVAMLNYRRVMWVYNNAIKTIPPVITIDSWYRFQPFPVMGGKNGFLIATLIVHSDSYYIVFIHWDIVAMSIPTMNHTML